MLYKYIHNTNKAAVLVYAMVFTMTVAATLYVASAVFNTQMRASDVAAYGKQEAVLNTNARDALMKAYVTGAKTGYGFVEDVSTAGTTGAWVYGTPISLTNTASPFGSTAYLIDPKYALLGFSNATQSSDAGGKALPEMPWRLVAGSTSIDSISTEFSGKPHLRASDFFTIPGWRPYMNTSNLTASIAAVDSGEQKNAPGSAFEFNSPSSISVSSNVSALFARRDLALTPALSGLRWVRTQGNYTLAASDSSAFGGAILPSAGLLRATAPVWMAEEPITNYQLLLVDLDSDYSGWKLVSAADNVSTASAAVIVSTLSSGSDVIPAKILVDGGIASEFSLGSSGFLGTSLGTAAPIVVSTGSLNPSATGAIAQFDLRYTNASTALSWGRAETATTAVEVPYSFDGLRSFMVAPMKPKELIAASASSTDALKAMRLLEVYNTQGRNMPRSSETAYSVYRSTEGVATSFRSSGSPVACYINPIVEVNYNMGVSKFSVSWTRQKTDGSVVKMNETLIAPASLPFSAPTLLYGSVGGYPISSGTSAPLTGLSAAVIGSSRIIVTLDLSTFDLSSLSDAKSGTSWWWNGPNEIHLYNLNGFSPSDQSDYDLLIKGATVATGTPLRIVTDAKVIRFDKAGNQRRFELVSTNKDGATAVFEADGVNAPHAWYGLLMAPGGLTLDTRRDYASGNAHVNSSASWFGTMYVGRFMKSQAGVYLRLSADDGAGISGAGAPYLLAGTVHDLFKPTYNATLPAGRPVPLVAPRMVWMAK